jgi:predicted nucleic acid-binding protein
LIIIDTDVLIEVSDTLSKKGNSIYQKIIASGDDVALISITMYEALYGLTKYSKPFHHLFSFPVYEFANEDAQRATKLDLDLDKKGRKIKRTDIMIASIAINKGAALYTFDKDFQSLEDFGLSLVR